MANCPKCGAARPEGAAECPRCGVIYARFEAMLVRKHEAEMEAARREQEKQVQATVSAKPEAPKRRGLVFCPTCKKQVSGNAESCPHCGEPIRDNPNLVSAEMSAGFKFGLFVVVPAFALLIGGLVWYAGHETRKSEEQAAEIYAEHDKLMGWDKSASGDLVIPENTLGCRNVEDFRKLADIAASHDHDAFAKAMINYAAAGRCSILTPGAKAYREDSSLRHGAVKVRLQGEVDSWWINMK